MYLCLLQEDITCIILHVTCWDVTCITLHVTCWDITCYMLRRYMYYITCYMLRRYMYYIHVRLSVTGRHYMYNITCHMLRCYMYTLHVTCWDITYYMLRCYIITYIYLCLLQGENPIYKQATSTFVNPTYRKWGSHPREDPNQDPDSDQFKGVSHAKQTNKQKQQKTAKTNWSQSQNNPRIGKDTRFFERDLNLLAILLVISLYENSMNDKIYNFASWSSLLTHITAWTISSFGW